MKTLFTTLFSACMLCAQAQTAVPPVLRAENTFDRLAINAGIQPGEFVYGIPLPPGETIGDYYLSADWRNSNLLLFEDEKVIQGYPVKYNIKADELEIKSASGVKVLRGAKVKSFVMADPQKSSPVFYVNVKRYGAAANGLSGFFEVAADGKVPLLKHVDIEIKKPDYSEALNVGSRDERILKKITFYHAVDNKLYKISKNRKKFIAAFPDKREQVSKFISDNELSLNEEEHLVRIYEYYNRL